MFRVHTLFLFTLFISAILSSPVQNQKRSFKVKRVPVPNYVPDGPKALRRALVKYGIDDITPLPNGDVATRLAAATSAAIDAANAKDGSVTASPTQNDAQFLSPVSVGGQLLIMNFDSGSSDTWVFNTNLNAASQTGHTIYGPKKSKSSKSLAGTTFNITYGDGSFATGPVGLDEVDIGGSTVAQQAIGLPNVVARSFVRDSASNGLVGLAFSKLNTMKPQKQKTFFDNVMPDLTLPVFTAQLKHGQVGAYEFGTIDTTAFKGQLTTVAVDSSRGFWEVDSTTAVVGNQTFNVKNGKAIIDTGTSLMLAFDDFVVGYWQQVDGAQFSSTVGGVIFPCNSTLPDLQVQIGDTYMAVVPGSIMNFAKAGTDRNTAVEFCFGGLQSNQGAAFAIYGDVFFKSQFVVFDGSGPSLGIAEHA